MSTTVEVVRFDVPPERAEALVAGHEAARLAIDSVAPGWIWARLARFDRRSWVELVAWRERASFERALELSVDQPDAAEWFELADPGWSIVLGQPREDERRPPPAEGTLELVAASAGENAAEDAVPNASSAWSMLLELEDGVWSGDSWRASPPGELRITAPEEDPGASARPGAEVATIAHSYDAAVGGRA
jgi:hypothetical protein